MFTGSKTYHHVKENWMRDSCDVQGLNSEVGDTGLPPPRLVVQTPDPMWKSWYSKNKP